MFVLVERTFRIQVDNLVSTNIKFACRESHMEFLLFSMPLRCLFVPCKWETLYGSVLRERKATQSDMDAQRTEMLPESADIEILVSVWWMHPLFACPLFYSLVNFLHRDIFAGAQHTPRVNVQRTQFGSVSSFCHVHRVCSFYLSRYLYPFSHFPRCIVAFSIMHEHGCSNKNDIEICSTSDGCRIEAR